jgi:hypothetical protein
MAHSSPTSSTPSLEAHVDDDAIKVWQDPSSYPAIPDHFIECPLGEQELEREYYSLTYQGVPSFYLKQEKLLEEVSTDKPLTTPTKTSSTKRAKTTMASLSPSTIKMRLRVMREFIGFCVKWLLLAPTMEHVMDPQVVAKYMGFHVAKGTLEGSLHVYATHLHQVAITFVNTPKCPKILPPILDHFKPAIMEWFANLNSKLLSSMSIHPKPKSNITLWRVWEACLSKWHTLQSKMVSRVGCMGVILTKCIAWSTPLSHCNAHHHPTQVQDNGCKWTKSLAHECQQCVLSMMVVGLYQPPMRVGALRVLHNSASTKSQRPCVCEECK